MQLKAGGRIRSAVCSTEVMVILAPQGEAELTCGGAPMLPLGTEPPGGASISADAKGGTQIGKRYVNEATRASSCSAPSPATATSPSAPPPWPSRKPSRCRPRTEPGTTPRNAARTEPWLGLGMPSD